MNDHYRNLIADEFRNCVSGTIHRITTNEQTYRPFHRALLSDEVLFWSAFERSFSTSFGQRVIEEIAKIVAYSNGAETAERQHVTSVVLDVARDDAINDHMTQLRDRYSVDYSWNSTVNSIIEVQPIGRNRQIRIISDLWWRKNGIDNYMSIKTVKPNIDQTAVAKEDCLRLFMNDQNCNVYFGLPYNPYGEDREDYSHNPPMGIFDFRHDPVVLIGRDMWDVIGGEGCYDELIDIATLVGDETKRMIAGLNI